MNECIVAGFYGEAENPVTAIRDDCSAISKVCMWSSVFFSLLDFVAN